MRPVEKKKVGEVVSYLDSLNQMVTETIKNSYSPYSTAKMPLLGNLGWYCSYCEGRKMPSEMAADAHQPGNTITLHAPQHAKGVYVLQVMGQGKGTSHKAKIMLS